MPVLVAITTSAGKRVEKIWLTSAAEDFQWKVAEEPLMVRFDEGNYLLAERRITKDEQEMLYQLEHDDVIGRAWAATELARTGGGERAAAALARASTLDPSWAVRRAAVESIGSWKRAQDVPRLEESAVDGSSRVRAAALSALGAFNDRGLAPFFRQRFDADDSYVAQAEALRGLGSAGRTDDLPFLRQAAALPSPRGVLKAAAESAIEAIGRQR
jgi:aminopeptidase N